ncbi:hypothetical protein ACHAXR_009883 [Thalassiosira sp. AJA248-18]
MSHLSELSIQLRKLQTEKNASLNEIDRLERQVRILSELKGISINDLQAALKAACEAEAHGELQAIVGKLQARVDGLELGGGGIVGGRRHGAKGNFDENNNIPTQEQFDQEAAARARTTLQLRIGELEEIESTLRSELDSLYHDFQMLTERNTFLETQVLQQKAQLDQWERRWKAKEEEELKASRIVPMPMPSAGSYNYSEYATTTNNPPAQEPILLHNAPQSQIDVENEQRALAAEMALVGEKQQRSIVQSRLSSAKKSYDLKIEQYQHRIQFLEEQLTDLEQQLSSLYAAFGIMQHDTKEERNERDALKKTLIESDEAIAKEQSKREIKQQQEQLSPAPKAGRSRRTLTKLISPPPPSQKRAAVKPAAHPPIVQGLLLLLLDKDDQPLPPNQTPSAPRQKSKRKMNLKLQKSSKSSAGLKYKKQYCVLHGANGLYQMRYGDTYTGPVSGVCEFITAGVSSIDHTPRSSSQSFGFEVMINPCDLEAPALCCAAETEADFMMWMSALTSVTDGSIERQHAQN